MKCVHYEESRGRAICGVKLTDRHQSTDNEGDMEAREGSHCKRCWRVIEARARLDRQRQQFGMDSDAGGES